jgi:hypothetical protein
MDREVHYAAVANDEIMRAFPWVTWPGGQTISIPYLTAVPAAGWRIETDAITPGTPTYDKFYASLKNVDVDTQAPLVNMGALSGQVGQRSTLIKSMAIGMGNALRSALCNSYSVTTTIGANIGAGVLGWDRVIPGPNMSLGLGEVEFDDAPANRIRFKAPGDSAFGAWVLTAGDLDEVALYSNDTTKYIFVTFDESDSEAGGDYTTTSLGGANADGILFATSKEPDGMNAWIHPDQRIWANLTASPANAGTALSTAIMDYMLDQVPQDGADNMAWVMHPRTRRAFKALMGAAPMEFVDTFMGTKLHRKMLAYENIPIWVSSNVPVNIPSGEADTTSATCTLINLVRVDPEDGFGSYYWNGSPMLVTDPGSEDRAPLPVYFRDLGEQATLVDDRLRMDTNICPFLKNYQAMCQVIGVNN